MKRMMSAIAVGLILAGAAAAAAEVEGDLFDPLEALASLGDSLLADESEEGGGSIRARQTRDRLAVLRLKDSRNLEAKITTIRKGTFPTVALKVKVTRPAQEGAGAKMAKNQTLVVFPRLKFSSSVVDLADDPTLLNAGAYYLHRGDKVMIRLGYQRGRVWEADYIERK